MSRHEAGWDLPDACFRWNPTRHLAPVREPASGRARERESERGSSCPFVRGGARVPVTVLQRTAHARATRPECTVKGTTAVRRLS